MRHSAKLTCVFLVIVTCIATVFYYRHWFQIYEESKYMGLSTLEYHPPKLVVSKNNSDAKSLLVVTCCQGEECMRHFHNLADSLSARGYNLFRIEMKGAFTWPKLAVAYSEVVAMLPASSLVLFLDPLNMFAQGCPSQLVKRFEELAASKNRSILAAVQSHCSNARKCHKMTQPPIPTLEGSYFRPERLYLNGGFILGRAEVCAQAWKEIGDRFLDMQLGWSTYAEEHSELVAIDWRQEVVASNTAKEWESEFHISQLHGVYHVAKDNSHAAKNNTINANSTHSTGTPNMTSEVVMPRTIDTARYPVFLHVLCHTCQEDNKMGVGGPRVHAQISKVIHMQSESANGTQLC